MLSNVAGCDWRLGKYRATLVLRDSRPRLTHACGFRATHAVLSTEREVWQRRDTDGGRAMPRNCDALMLSLELVRVRDADVLLESYHTHVCPPLEQCLADQRTAVDSYKVRESALMPVAPACTHDRRMDDGSE